MAQQGVLGRSGMGGWLTVYGFLEGGELVVRQHPEEALEQDHGFPEAGVQVKVIVIQSFP